jgi:hypothetical protein
MLVTPQDVTKFTPRLSPRAEQYKGTRLVFRIGPRSSSGSAFPIESGSDFAIVSENRYLARFLRNYSARCMQSLPPPIGMVVGRESAGYVNSDGR